MWWLLKYGFNRLPAILRPAYAYTVWYAIIGLNILKYTLLLKPMQAIRPLLTYRPRRGMSVRHDILDWMGGFPFEFATYEVLVAYLGARGFEQVKGTPNPGIGCHEMVLRRTMIAP